jgi:hypothetical protein
MVARLGRVIYWTACGAALLWGSIGILFGAFAPNARGFEAFIIAVAVIGAALIWGVSRAALYVLAGE